MLQTDRAASSSDFRCRHGSSPFGGDLFPFHLSHLVTIKEWLQATLGVSDRSSFRWCPGHKPRPGKSCSKISPKWRRRKTRYCKSAFTSSVAISVPLDINNECHMLRKKTSRDGGAPWCSWFSFGCTKRKGSLSESISGLLSYRFMVKHAKTSCVRDPHDPLNSKEEFRTQISGHDVGSRASGLSEMTRLSSFVFRYMMYM